MANYSATSHLAGEFIHDGEIRATLEYASEHHEDMARYSILHDNERLFQAKYLTFLPTKEELTKEIEHQKMVFRLQQENESFNQ